MASGWSIVTTRPYSFRLPDRLGGKCGRLNIERINKLSLMRVDVMRCYEHCRRRGKAGESVASSATVLQKGVCRLVVTRLSFMIYVSIFRLMLTAQNQRNMQCDALVLVYYLASFATDKIR